MGRSLYNCGCSSIMENGSFDKISFGKFDFIEKEGKRGKIVVTNGGNDKVTGTVQFGAGVTDSD